MKNLALATVSILVVSLVSQAHAHAQPATQPTAPLKKVTKPAATQHAAPKSKKHHVRKHHHKARPSAHGEAPYVVFPPAQGCAPQYYYGSQAYPYMYHGGYFWYPHPQADQLMDYSPYYGQGYYWYPSYMHPHMLYMDGKAPVYVLPHHVDGSVSKDAAMHKRHPHHMRKLHKTAPTAKAVK